MSYTLGATAQPVTYDSVAGTLDPTSTAALAASGYLRGAFPLTPNYTPGYDTAMASPPTVTTSATQTLGGAYFQWNSAQVSNNMQMVMSGAPPYCIYSQVDGGSNGRLPGGGMASWIDTDSQNVEINILEFQTGHINILVDGQFVSLTPTSTGSSFANRFIKLAFSSRVIRRIRIEYVGCLFGGFVVDANATALVRPKTPRIHIVGDSYVQTNGGEGANLSNTSQCLVHQIARRLGYDNVWANGSAGTGYVRDIPGSSTPNIIDRMATDLIPYLQDGDIVLSLNGYNDRVYTNDQVTAAIATFVSRIKAAGKNVVTVIATQFSPRPDSPPLAAVPGADAAFTAAALAAGAFTFDQSDALTGGGYNGAGTGNSALYIGADGIHPSAAGYVYLATVLTAKLKACLVGK